MEQLYCEKCERFLPDRYVEGKCPHCNEEARGDQCDNCGSPLEPIELIEPYCITCKAKPIVKKTEHVFFDLPKIQNELLDWIEKHDGLFSNAKNFALSFIKNGLKEKDISREISWGIPIPDAKGLVFYVWFDAPIGYITFTKQLGKENWWKDENTKLVHFLGKDNIPFHAIYFPGMLKAHGEYKLPDKIASYEFLTFGGSKLSKSKGRLIKALEALETYPTDYWRFVLISLLPENKDSDFTWEIFQEIVNNDLNDTLGNFIHRTLTFSDKYYGRKVSKPELTETDLKILKTIEETSDNVEKLMYNIELKKALQETIALVRKGNQFITAEEPWKNEERRQNVIYVCLSIAKAVSILLEPFIPESADRIKKFLNLKDLKWEDAKQLQESFQLGGFEPLFKKIEDDELEKVIEKFSVKKEVNPMIKYEDFAKLDLKVAEIKTAEKVAGADKLLKISIDLGNEQRTLAAGLAEYYSPEELIGRKIIVLTNLEPRKIKGIESNGMLLAAETEEGTVGLLMVDKDLKPGAIVR